MGEFGEFGEIIKRLREEAELTQEREAKLMHISRSNVAMYESGTRRPSRETLEAFADFYNVDIDYLLGRSSKTTRARGAGYYFDPETAKAAEEMRENKDLKVLFDAARDASPEDLRTAAVSEERREGDDDDEDDALDDFFHGFSLLA